MATPIKPDGIVAAADREKEFHPASMGGTTITAWDRRAKTLVSAIDVVNSLNILATTTALELAELKKELASRPF